MYRSLPIDRAAHTSPHRLSAVPGERMKQFADCENRRSKLEKLNWKLEKRNSKLEKRNWKSGKRDSKIKIRKSKIAVQRSQIDNRKSPIANRQSPDPMHGTAPPPKIWKCQDRTYGSIMLCGK